MRTIVVLLALGAACMAGPTSAAIVGERDAARRDIEQFVAVLRNVLLGAAPAADICQRASTEYLRQVGGPLKCRQQLSAGIRSISAAERHKHRTMRIRSIKVIQVDGVWYAGATTNLMSGMDPFVLTFVKERGHYRYLNDN